MYSRAWVSTAGRRETFDDQTVDGSDSENDLHNHDHDNQNNDDDDDDASM